MCVLGIDIGGSTIKGAPVDPETGELLDEELRIPTPYPGNPEQVMRVIQNMADDFGCERKMGVGFPAVVRRGVIGAVANISEDWEGVNLVRLIQKRMGCPAMVLNDADAAGIAEMRFGIGREYLTDYVLFLTLGTGIGSAFFVKGNLWPNTELGHLQVRGMDAERWAGDSVRREKGLSWDEWGERFQEVLAMYDFLFNPDVIILGGGLSHQIESYEHWLKKIQANVRPAKLGNKAGIIGAAIAAAESLMID